MSDTTTVNYKEIYSTKTVEKIEELLEDSYDLDDMLTFIDENSEEDFVAHYENYCSAGESIGYDVVDAFVKHHGDMCYVEHVEEAFRGVYSSVESFTEEYITEICDVEIPVYLVVDWKATWESSVRFDYDFVDGYVFEHTF